MDSALSVQYPGDPNRTLWDARLDKGPFTGPAGYDGQSISDLVIARAEEELAVEQDEIPVHPLGSGSDFTVMLQRLGVCFT
jgi:N-acetylated-alpha-linked acidic dipeptidase